MTAEVMVTEVRPSEVYNVAVHPIKLKMIHHSAGYPNVRSAGLGVDGAVDLCVHRGGPLLIEVEGQQLAGHGRDLASARVEHVRGVA